MTTPITNRTKKVVLIIGNGFDLDLELHTNYKEFVNSQYFRALLSGELPPDISLVSSIFKNELEQIVPCKIAQFIKEEIDENHNKWVDLELSLKHYCTFQSANIDKSTFEKELNALRVLLYKFLSLNYPYNSNSYYKDKKSYYFGMHIGKLLLTSIAKSNLDWSIWNFNYTDSCEKILENIISANETQKRIHYIHGTIQKSDWSGIDIVIGTDSDEHVLNVFPALMKSHRPEYYAIKHAFDEDLLATDFIIIMGTSLGETDEDYFNHLFDSNHLKSILIISKDKESSDRIFQRLQVLSKRSAKGSLMDRIKNGDLNYLDFSTDGYYLQYRISEEKRKEFERILHCLQ